MTRDKQTIESWINQVNDNGVNLTKWEMDFMESITDQFRITQSISDKQEEILDRIYTNRVP